MKIDSIRVGFISTNCYLLCDEEAGVCALIDPGDKPEQVADMVSRSGCRLEYILLTHGHFDHTTAVRPLLEKYPDVPVYIHEKDVTDQPPKHMDMMFSRLPEHNQRYYKEGDTLTLGSLTIRVMETPGHTQGSVCLLVGDVMFSGDTLFRGSCGRTDFAGGDPKAIANTLRRRLRQELGLTISVGVSFNKVFAKLGSDYKKPDATTVISRENWQDIVWPLPVGDLLFVGRAAGRVLHQYGVETIGQLAACSPQMLETLLGKLGLQLHEYANGLDGSPVRPAGQQEPVKSVGNGTTFPKNLTRWEEVQRGLAVLSDSVAMRLRQQGLYCGGVSVSLRNAQFRTVSRQMRLPAPTHLMKDIWQSAMELTRRLWKAPEPVRMLTVTALYITDSADSFQQLDLLETPAVSRQQEKQEKLERAMDAIRGKYGRGSISFGLPGEERAGWDD